MRPILHRPEFIVGLPVAAALLLAGACSPAPQPLSSRDLERPTDVSFVCVGLFPDDAAATATPDGGTDAAASTSRVSGRPMSECHPPLEFDPIPVDVTHRSFGFLTNTARGELSVVDMDASKLLDLDHGVPGINPVAIGDLPEQMSVSDDGCRIVTANRGSCDLSLVDPSALVTDQLRSENKTASSIPEPGRATTRVTIKTPAGTDLSLAPQEILFLPQDTSAETGGANLCPAAIDQAGVTPWRALVTLPSCNLIALVDLPSGTIIDSLQATAQGGGVTLSRPADPNHPCDSPTAAVAYTDCGDHQNPPPASTAAGSQPRPGALAILPDGSRAYVAFAGAAVVAAINLTADTLTAGGTIALHEDALGADRIRLSVDPYQKTGQPGHLGRFVGEGPDRLRQYLYVVARDGTVRVVDVSPAARQEPEQECETNLDPLTISADPASPVYDVRAASCVPVDSDPTHHFRRGDARGPGIRLPTVPRDVTFADLKLGDPRQEVLDGSFAFILTSSGAVYIVNIDPTLRTKQVTPPNAQKDVPANTEETPPAASSLRDRNVITYTTALDPATGPARIDVDPVPGGPGPFLQSVDTTDYTDNVRVSTPSVPVATSVFFPVKGTVRAQTWTITWEGDLFGPGFAGQITIPAVSDAGKPPVAATFEDAGVDFCQAGTQTGDIITILGCNVDSDCGPLRVCRHSETAPQTIGNLPINGLCVSSEPAAQTDDMSNCAALLPTVKRYTIQKDATTKSIQLLPKLDEVPSALLSGCQSNSDCQPAIDPSRRAFTCEPVDPSDTKKRCVQVCDEKTACRTGRACDLSRHLCADGPPLGTNEKNCLQQLFAYKIQAGNAFIVQGSAPQPSLPYGNVKGVCSQLKDIPGRDPLLVNRIPLDPPPGYCAPPTTISTDQTIDPATRLTIQDESFLGLVGSGNKAVPTPNPCLLTDATVPVAGTGGMNGTGGAGGMNGTGGAGGAGGSNGTGGAAVVIQQPYVPHQWIQFQNAEIRFLLTHLDEPTTDITQIRFDVHGGFAPDLVVIPTTIDIEMPARIVVSPFDSQGQLADRSATHELPYLYVVDQRRLGRASAGVGPTRGQFLRINPRKANSDGSNLFPVYDEPDTTGGLWPIQ